MVEKDCGAIPVVESQDNRWPVGVITDRDITCPTVAQQKNPLELSARDAMSDSVVTVQPDMPVDVCCETMVQHQVRRVPVVDGQSRCCGIIAQADVARHRSEQYAGHVVRVVSAESDQPSRLAT